MDKPVSRPGSIQDEGQLNLRLDLVLAMGDQGPPFTPAAHSSALEAARLNMALDWSQPPPEPRYTDATQRRLMAVLRASRDRRGLSYRPDGWC
jgi:hypothetical protein